MKTDLPDGMRRRVAFEAAKMAGSFREQVELLFVSANGKTMRALEREYLEKHQVGSNVRELARAEVSAQLAFAAAMFLCDAIGRWRRDVDARLARLERDRL